MERSPGNINELKKKKAERYTEYYTNVGGKIF